MTTLEEAVSMLVDLKDVLDDIENSNDWEYRFVSDLLIRKEEGKLGRLTDKQSEQLERIYGHYI